MFAFKPSNVLTVVPVGMGARIWRGHCSNATSRHDPALVDVYKLWRNRLQQVALVCICRFKAYRDPARNNALIYVAEREFRNEQDRDRPMTEREVIVELYKSGWQPEEIVLIADASGQWQNSESRQKGGVRGSPVL